MSPSTPEVLPPETMKHEIALCLEEYKAVRAEIGLNLGNSFATIALTLTAAGGLVALFGALSAEGRPTAGKPYWLAIAPLVFHALLWVQLRLGYNVFNLGNYVAEVLSPRLQAAIGSAGSNGTRIAPPFAWEHFARTPPHSNEYWLLPIEGARYAIPLAAGIATFVGYFFVLDVSPDLHFDPLPDGLLITLNAVLATYSSYAVWKMRALLRTQPSQFG